jgi:hypothetical protein
VTVKPKDDGQKRQGTQEASGLFNRIERARAGMSRASCCTPREQCLRIAIDEMPPASPMERFPVAFRLGEPVGDRVKRGRMRAKAEVA